MFGLWLLLTVFVRFVLLCLNMFVCLFGAFVSFVCDALCGMVCFCLCECLRLCLWCCVLACVVFGKLSVLFCFVCDLRCEMLCGF